MDEREKKSIIDLYEKRLDNYGRDVKTVGWRSRSQQYARFEALYRIGDLTNKSVLDIGCGFGDLYDFFKRKKNQIQSYKGIDLSSKMIEKAKNIHSESKDVKFEVMDLSKLNIDVLMKEKYDYIFASGIFSYPLKNNISYFQDLLYKMFKICNLGVAVNMLSSYVDYKDKNLYYFVPEDVFSYGKSLTKRVSLIHNYMPYEFTFYLYKDETIDDDNVFTKFRIDSEIKSTKGNIK